MVRAACYYRISKEKERSISIDVQREMCERVARDRGWLLVETYVDDGKSAYTDNLAKRPAFQRLLADAKVKRFDVVLVYKFDRFARKRKVFFGCIDDLEAIGIAVESATESNDWLSVGFNGLMAEQYSRMLSARMKDVRRWEASQGLHAGRVPVGYTRHRGVLAPSDQAEAVRYLGRLYATGNYSIVRLTEAVNRAGYTMPGGAPFRPEGVKDLVRCPVYAGFIVHDGISYQGGHEPLWDADLWAQIQAVTARRSEGRVRHDPKHNALLTGIAACAMCGGNMTHTRAGREDLRYYRCLCANRRTISPLGLTCRAPSAYAGDVEQVLIAWLGGLALLPELLEKAQQMLARPAASTGPTRGDIETRLRRLARAYADGAYADNEYEQRRAELLAQLTRTHAAPAIDLEAGLALLSDLPALLNEALPVERQMIVRQLVARVYIYRYDIWAIRPTRTAEAFFQVADREAWLTIVQNSVRSASNADIPYWLKRVPVLLAA